MFFVHILESPSPKEVNDEVSEGQALKKLLDILDVPSELTRVSNFSELSDAISKFTKQSSSEYDGYTPVLHMSGHSDQTGFGLTDSSVVVWKQLKDLLVPLNVAVKKRLIIAMSSCKGAFAAVMALAADNEGNLPYDALVGTEELVEWGEATIAYSVFYFWIAKHDIHNRDGGYIRLNEEDLQTIVKRMREASGHDGFRYWTSLGIRELHREQLVDFIMKKGRGEQCELSWLSACWDEQHQAQYGDQAYGF